MWFALALAAPDPSPTAYAKRYVVIVGTEAKEASLDPLEARVRAQSPSTALARLSSTDFVGLRPCWQLLVAGAFPQKSAAEAQLAALKLEGIDGYVRATGAYLGHLPGRDSACVVGGGSAWMVADGALVLGHDYQLWGTREEPGGFAPDPVELAPEEHWGLSKGDRVQVSTPDGDASAVCAVTGFEARPGRSTGQPCPGADVVALLSPGCAERGFAVRDAAASPVVWTEASTAGLPVEALGAELWASPLAVEERERQRQRATPGLPATEKLAEPQAWSGPGGAVVVTRIDHFVPAEEVHCGIDGEYTRVHRATWILPSGERRELATQATGGAATIERVVDLDANGVPELWWVDGDGMDLQESLDGTAAPILTRFCGCPC